MVARSQFEPKRKGSAQSTSVLQRKCACGTGSPRNACEACSKNAEQELRRSASGSTNLVSAPSIVNKVLDSPGRPLEATTRTFMESRFGRDFSDVRVHTDLEAAQSAHAVGALAYTVGGDIVFGAEQYSPHSAEGRKL